MREERKASGIDLSVMEFGDYSDGMRWGGIEHKGKVYLICSEGVGYDVSARTEDEVLKGWGKSRAQIIADIRQGENGFIELEKLIRQFGDRLEVNYSLWLNRLSN